MGRYHFGEVVDGGLLGLLPIVSLLWRLVALLVESDLVNMEPESLGNGCLVLDLLNGRLRPGSQLCFRIPGIWLMCRGVPRSSRRMRAMSSSWSPETSKVSAGA